MLAVAQMMTELNVGAVSVLDGQKLVGIFSERDLMNRVVSRALSPWETRVEQCLRVMNQAKCRHLPVATEGRLVGMISMRDLLLHHLQAKDSEIEMMRAFIHYLPPSPPAGPGH